MNMHAPVRKPIKLIKVGNSLGIILSKEVLARLGVDVGDLLDAVDSVDGIRLQRHDAGFATQMDTARDVMKRRRDALRELAK